MCVYLESGFFRIKISKSKFGLSTHIGNWKSVSHGKHNNVSPANSANLVFFAISAENKKSSAESILPGLPLFGGVFGILLKTLFSRWCES